MKKLGFIAVCCAVMTLAACSWFQHTVAPVLQPLVNAGCAIETSVMGGFGSEVVAECQGTDPAACGAAFQTALGNVNLCNIKLPAPSLAVGEFKSLLVAHPQWKTIGDITDQDLKDGKTKAAVKGLVKTMGIVGGIACPIAINTGLGLLTGVIPAACGCKNSLNASQVGQGLINACIAAVPL